MKSVHPAILLLLILAIFIMCGAWYSCKLFLIITTSVFVSIHMANNEIGDKNGRQN